jgi:Putative lumazine-binding
MPYRRACAAAALVAATLAGCGGQTDTAAVRATMARLERATAAKDYKTLCTQVLAPSLLAKVHEVGLGCEQALSRGLGGVRSPQLVVRSIQLHGSTALVNVHSSAANQASSDDTVQLVKVGGQWRVSSLANPGAGG